MSEIIKRLFGLFFCFATPYTERAENTNPKPRYFQYFLKVNCKESRLLKF